MAKVTYDGPTKRGASHTGIRVGKVMLLKGVETDVTDEEVLARLTAGIEGHKFTVGNQGAPASNTKPKE